MIAKLTEEQFEALEAWVEAVARDIAGGYFNRNDYSHEERRAAYDALVEEATP